MSVSTFEEILNNGTLVYTSEGDSMLPLIRQGRDVLVIKKREDTRLKKYDVVLFKRDNKYILHRILKVRKNDYYIVGDNRYVGEYVLDNQIIGVLTSVIRDKKEISFKSKKYLLYVHLWCDFFFIRKNILRIKKLLKKKARV